MSMKSETMYGTIHWSKKIDALYGAVTIGDGIAGVSFVYWSAMTTSNCFLAIVFASGLKYMHCDQFQRPANGDSFR